MRRRGGVVRLPVLAGAALGTLAGAPPLAAQTLQGRVLDAADGRVVPQTLVRLVTADGAQVALTISDLEGGYRLQAPAPGVYRVEGDRLGYEDYRSADVELPRAGATYSVDLLIRSEAIPIRGLRVTGRRRQAVEEDLDRLVGLSMNSIRNRPIHRAVIEDHLARGHEIEDLIQWANLPSVTVRRTTEGPCFQFRARGCLPVYLNGVAQGPAVVPLLPLEMVEAVVVLQPKESIQYPAGAILLYTAGWLQRAPR